MLGAEAEQGLEGGHRGAAPVVAKDMLVEVKLQVGIPDVAVGAVKPRLEIGDGAVGAGRQLLAGRGALTAGAVVVAELAEAVVGRPAVGVGDRAAGRGRRRKLAERVARGVRQDREAKPPRALAANLDRDPRSALFAPLLRPWWLSSRPPRKNSSISTSPLSGSRSGATIARRGFCRISQAVS
jgi:hypothetical protein